jgi:hypothetical protein
MGEFILHTTPRSEEVLMARRRAAGCHHQLRIYGFHIRDDDVDRFKREIEHSRKFKNGGTGWLKGSLCWIELPYGPVWGNAPSDIAGPCAAWGIEIVGNIETLEKKCDEECWCQEEKRNAT